MSTALIVITIAALLVLWFIFEVRLPVSSLLARVHLRYGLIFLVVHTFLILFGIFFLYQPGVANSDLELLVLPNVFVYIAVMSVLLPSPIQLMVSSSITVNLFLFGGLFWFIVGALVGAAVQWYKQRKQPVKVSS